MTNKLEDSHRLAEMVAGVPVTRVRRGHRTMTEKQIRDRLCDNSRMLGRIQEKVIKKEK